MSSLRQRLLHAFQETVQRSLYLQKLLISLYGFCFCFFVFVFSELGFWDTIHARLKSHYEASSHENKDKRLKLVSAIFYQIFIFHQIIALQKLWKMFFISSKKLFWFSRYSNFCIFVLVQKIILVYDVIICLNKSLIITHFVWHREKEVRCDIETLLVDRELNKELFLWNNYAEICTKS